MARKHKKRRTHVEEDTQVKRRRRGQGGGDEELCCDEREVVVASVPFPIFPLLDWFFLFSCICTSAAVTQCST